MLNPNDPVMPSSSDVNRFARSAKLTEREERSGHNVTPLPPSPLASMGDRAVWAVRVTGLPETAPSGSDPITSPDLYPGQMQEIVESNDTDGGVAIKRFQWQDAADTIECWVRPLPGKNLIEGDIGLGVVVGEFEQLTNGAGVAIDPIRKPITTLIRDQEWFEAEITDCSEESSPPLFVCSWKRLSFGLGAYPDFSPATTGTLNAVPLPLPNTYVGVCTITIASPGVVTITETSGKNTVGYGDFLIFSTTGALPTGITAGTPYAVHTFTSHSVFTITALPAGSAINTSGSQSGVHTLYKSGYPPVSVGSKVLMRLMAGDPYFETDVYEFQINQYAGDMSPTTLPRPTPGIVSTGNQTLFGNKTFVNYVPAFPDVPNTVVSITDAAGYNQIQFQQFAVNTGSSGIDGTYDSPALRVFGGGWLAFGVFHPTEAGFWSKASGYTGDVGYWYTSNAFAIGNLEDGLTDLGRTADIDLAAMAALGAILRFVGGIYVGYTLPPPPSPPSPPPPSPPPPPPPPPADPYWCVGNVSAFACPFACIQAADCDAAKTLYFASHPSCAALALSCDGPFDDLSACSEECIGISPSPPSPPVPPSPPPP